MLTTIAIAMIMIHTFTVPIEALSCVYCNDCTNANTVRTNHICGTGEDTCMKLDFGHYIVQKCGIHSTMCTKDGFKANSQNIWVQIKSAVGSVEAEAELLTNVNSQGREVLNCCNDKHLCNAGKRTSVTVMAVLGMVVLAYITDAMA